MMRKGLCVADGAAPVSRDGERVARRARTALDATLGRRTAVPCSEWRLAAGGGASAEAVRARCDSVVVYNRGPG